MGKFKFTFSTQKVICEFSTDDFSDAEKVSKQFFETFERSKTEKVTAKKSDSKTLLCSPDELYEWIGNLDGRHSESWLCKNSPFKNTKRVLGVLEKSGRLTYIQTSYTRSNGHTGFMKAAYLDSHEAPQPFSMSTSEQKAALYRWVQENPGHRPRFVEQNCGIPSDKANRTLTLLLIGNKLQSEQDKDRKSRITAPDQAPRVL